MQTPNEKLNDIEPDTRNCTTERITANFEMCWNNKACKIGFSVGETTIICLHPDHIKFRRKYYSTRCFC